MPLAAAAASLMPGWHEAVLIVPSLAPWIETLTTVGGWEVLARSAPDNGLNALWRLPAGVRTEQVVLRNIGAVTGYLRLIRVTGAPQVQIRPDDQAWETGGINALDMRVTSIAETCGALHARGWRAPSAPVQYRAYGVEDIQWAPVSPDGIRLSFIQRIAPKLTGWPELKHWSRAANAAVTTENITAAQAFFTRKLGWREVGHTNSIGSNGPNVMGLPYALARDLAVDIRGFSAGPNAGGSVELISIPAARGRDFSVNAHPPNFGIAALRIRTKNAAAAAARLNAGPRTVLEIPPYGTCNAFSLTGTDGVCLEFFQTLQ